MELPSKLLEQKIFNNRHKVEEHMLVATHESVHEGSLSQLVKTNIKHFKNAIALLTGINDKFIVTIENKNFHFATSKTNKKWFHPINNSTWCVQT